MDAPVLTAIVAALAAIAGTSVGALFQLRLARINNHAQRDLQSDRLRTDTIRGEIETLKRHIVEVHRAISQLSRQFSITALDIHWRAGMPEEAFDQHYLSACESLDEIRAISDLYLPSVSEHVEAMYGQMNIFWGNFKEMLRLAAMNEPYERKQSFHLKSIEAAQQIASHAHRAKGELASLAGNVHATGG